MNNSIFTKKMLLFIGVSLVAINSFSQSDPPPVTSPIPPSTPECTNVLSCGPGSFTANFLNGTYVPGTGTGNITNAPTSVGAIWRFTNVAVLEGQPLNATISVDVMNNASLHTLDYDDANSGTIADYFVPLLTAVNDDGPSGIIQTDMGGYVQFTITFYQNIGSANPDENFSIEAAIPDLNYSHFDIDGVLIGGQESELRETGVVEDVPELGVVAVNAVTELSAYSYSGDGKDWQGFAGGTFNRIGTPRCSKVTASFRYFQPRSSITVRMGYDFTFNGSPLNSSTIRQYVTKIECVEFPEEAPLPVKLKSFSASRRQSNVELKWTTTIEQNNSGFELQRQSGAGGWQKIAFVESKATNGNSTGDLNYSYTDMNDSRGITQYRLLQIDFDDHAAYSEIRTVHGMGQDGRTIISPNPSANGMVNVTFGSAGIKRDLQLTDMQGRMLRQWKAYADNSLQLTGLQNGIYHLRIVDAATGAQSIEKIVVNGN